MDWRRYVFGLSVHLCVCACICLWVPPARRRPLVLCPWLRVNCIESLTVRSRHSCICGNALHKLRLCSACDGFRRHLVGKTLRNVCYDDGWQYNTRPQYDPPADTHKADIDRRLRPRCCRLGSYFKRPKSSRTRPLACNWYYCAQFIAKPKAACALHLARRRRRSTLAYEQIWRHPKTGTT